MSEIQSLAAPKASFDRRSVVKTAAWSVPVIAAAIAAPAAAASVVTPPVIPPSVALAGEGTSRTINPGSKTLLAPTGIFIYNTTGVGSSTDNVNVTLQITRDSADMPGLSIPSLGGLPGKVGSYVGNTITATYSIPVARSTAVQSFNFGTFAHDGNGNSLKGSYSMRVDVALPAPTGTVSTSSKPKLTLSGK